jgi:hypothetical protein
VSDAIWLIKDAASEVETARRQSDAEVLETAQKNLREEIRAAVDAGTSWQSVGEALGLRRGAAYQRYRRRGRAC